MNHVFYKTACHFILGNLAQRPQQFNSNQILHLLIYASKTIAPHSAQDLTLQETLINYLTNLHDFAINTHVNAHNSSFVFSADNKDFAPEQRQDYTNKIYQTLADITSLESHKPSQSLSLLQTILKNVSDITNQGQTLLYPSADHRQPLYSDFYNTQKMGTILEQLKYTYHVRF